MPPLRARFSVGDLVLALEPWTPRYIWGIIKRVIDVHDGPDYEVQFAIDSPDEEFICTLPEAYIFEDPGALNEWRMREGSARPKYYPLMLARRDP
mgnify:FL=1|jgi:hypothetical protein